MTKETVTLIAAIVAAASSFVSLFVGSRLTFNRERRQGLLRKEMDRLYAVEEQAGEIAEIAGNYKRVWSGTRDRFIQLIAEVDASAGRMARYPTLRQSLRDLSNVCARLYNAKEEQADDREIRKELEPALQAVHRAVKAVLKTVPD